MRGLAGLLVAVTAVGLLAFEAAMQPSAADRVRIVVVFGVTAAAAAAAGWWVLSRVSRSRSLVATLTLLTISAVVVAAGVTAVSAVTMFLSAHDLRVVLVALGVGVLLALSLGGAVLRQLTADLRRLADAAHRIGSGDLRVRTGVERADELGEVARALDRAAAELAEAEERRRSDEDSRRALLTGISHDLRTPLTSARIAVEAVRDGMAEDDRRYLGSAVRDLELAGRLVDDLFLLARLRGGDVHLERLQVDVGEVVDGVVEELTPLAVAAGVALTVEADGPGQAEVDPHAIGRVVRNLIDNAIRHAPPGSTVTAQVVGVPGQVRVVVRDAGPGLSHAQVSRIGEGPSGADDHGGFGLAVAVGLVRAHAGELEAVAGPGGQVGFRIPVAASGDLPPG